MHVLQSAKEQLTLNYGSQKLNGKPYNHKGLDFVKQYSSLDYIVACQTGKVIAIRTSIPAFLVGSYGNYVILEHSGGIRTLYAHMKYGSVKVKLGDMVKQGQVIGYMGATGGAYGAHLHFEVQMNGVPVNPTPYIQDKIKINAYGTAVIINKYTIGSYKTLTNMRVRTGAGTQYRAKVKKELSKDGQKHANMFGSYVKNTVFTAKRIITNADGSVWAESPSGFICIKDTKTTYCVKV